VDDRKDRFPELSKAVRERPATSESRYLTDRAGTGPIRARPTGLRSAGRRDRRDDAAHAKIAAVRRSKPTAGKPGSAAA
jgi:hypothetical protein